MPARKRNLNPAARAERLLLQTIEDMFEIIIAPLEAAVSGLSRLADFIHQLPSRISTR